MGEENEGGEEEYQGGEDDWYYAMSRMAQASIPVEPSKLSQEVSNNYLVNSFQWFKRNNKL